jgi:hypothetical protein
MFFRDSIWGRLKLLGGDEIIIERQNLWNPINLFFLLVFLVPIHILWWLFTLGRNGIRFREWFLYEYSLRDNIIYHLRNENNYYAHKIAENERKLITLEGIKKDEIALLKGTGQSDTPWCSDWMWIKKDTIYRKGRMKKVEPNYRKILSKEYLKNFQRGRKWSEYGEPELDLPSSDTSIYVMSDGDKGINRFFQAAREEFGADNVMEWKEPDNKNKDGKEIPRKRQKNEPADAHERRLKAMDSGNFDPGKWDWQAGKPK